MLLEQRDQLITDINVREFFQGAVQNAISNQHLTVSGETEVYLGNLLTSFINSERLYDHTPDGVMIRPLAQRYLEALEATNSVDRINVLRRLGDISLFISGLFSHSLSRSLVDVDYYISMGGNAYGYLSDANHRSTVAGLKQVFAELSGKFTELVDVLSEVGEAANLSNNNNILRIYEIWLKSGSKRAAEKLKLNGIHPIRTRLLHH